VKEEQLDGKTSLVAGNQIAQLPRVDLWLNELAQLVGDDRTERLHDMVRVVKGAGGCGSLQTANGLPCRRSPKAGYPVCRKHGERAPQTVAKAERLLAIARMPAIEGILDEIDQSMEESCDTCGYPNGTLKYKKYIASLRWQLLNRTGFGPRSSIDLTAKAVDEHYLDVSQLSEQEFEELSMLLEALDVFKGKIASRQVRESLAIPSARAVPLLVQATGVVEGQETKG